MAGDLFGSREAGRRGGSARARSLSKSRRAEIARIAAESRWLGWNGPIKRAIAGDEARPLRIGDAEIPAYVLEDETRVLAFRGLQTSLGFHESGGGGAPRFAQMLAKIGVSGSSYNELTSRLDAPIPFYLPGGGRAHGYEARVLADICDAVLDARKDGRLPKRLGYIAERCEVLVRGWARVGIIALVDEVTGFQALRSSSALAHILEAFIAKELQPWVKTFPMKFYEGIFRLRRMSFDPTRPILKRPKIIGSLTNDLVYKRLAPGVLEELQRVNPARASGNRQSKHHQHLTREIGHPKLQAHLAAVVALMDVSDEWKDFMAKMDKALIRQPLAPLFRRDDGVDVAKG